LLLAPGVAEHGEVARDRGDSRMDEWMHRAALRAAAKVALAGLVGGCGAHSELPGGGAATPEPGGRPAADASADGRETSADAQGADAREAATDAADAAALACAAQAGGDEEGVFTCCLETVGRYFPDGGFAGELPAAAAADPEAVACCPEIVGHVEDAFVDGGADPSAVWSRANDRGVLASCCNALDNPMGPACTPWGPPVPPAMPGAELGVA
jgi:hypothetical protein